MTLPAAPPKPYTPPKLRTLTPESWQARVLEDAEKLHAGRSGSMLILQLGDGPVRWWVARPNGIDRT